ncbi:dihydroxyacetone kinase phosphoryl donor subunit DhaM [Georgenia sp. SYP-B2076]|uniref:dihydroxyacetone kinase phosphoryl donor subunit DhaM n=1 Tax=Georgenia sp. SYP-B2076 TaxID=2495881 RepID=UPI001F0BDE37|nr:dihydroxyacetone kinase phosphoryl donor subunit DhaM [Georgenia sp. SYP-B2076]
MSAPPGPAGAPGAADGTGAGAARAGLVIVSHSARLADGVVEVAAQMAPDVLLRAAGGTDGGGVGTSFEKVEAAVTALLGEPSVSGVVVLTDLGSATMTAESVLEMLDDDRRDVVVLADGPLVEGAVAGAVAAQGGADVRAVARTVAEAARSFGAGQGGAGQNGGEHGGAGAASSATATATAGGAGNRSEGEVVARVLTLRNKVGLHARPAALLARLVSGFDAEVTVNDVDATSVLALMGLGLEMGDQMRVRAGGEQAEVALDAVARAVDEGFGEE